MSGGVGGDVWGSSAGGAPVVQQGINVGMPPYSADPTGLTDATAAFRAAIAACQPRNQNAAYPLITRMVPMTITYTTTTATVSMPPGVSLPAWFANGMTVNVLQFSPALLNGNGFVVSAVDLVGNTFQYPVSAGTPGAATAWGYVDIPAGPTATAASIGTDGVTLTITMPQPLPAFVRLPNATNPVLDPGSAIQLVGWVTTGTSINSAAGTWYTVQTMPANNQLTLTLPAGVTGITTIGTVQAFGYVPMAVSDSGVINTPTPVLITSTSTLAYGQPLLIPPGNYSISSQAKDAPNTAILTLYQVSVIGAGTWHVTIVVQNSPGTAVPMSGARPIAGVPAIDCFSHQVGMRVSGFTLNWRTNGAAFALGTALGVSGGLSTVQGAQVRAASVAPVVSGGVITSVTVIDGGIGYVSAPTITQYNGGTPATFTPVLSGTSLQSVGVSGGTAIAQAPHVPWAQCDGIRLNSGMELDHVIVTAFDAGLVYNSFGGGLQVHDVVVQACYYGFYFFMEGGNDESQDLEATNCAMACFAWHNNTAPEPTHHSKTAPDATLWVARRVYAGQAPFGMFAEAGYGTAQAFQQYAEYHDFGFELVNVAAIYAADAALTNSPFPGMTNCKFTHPFTANYWTRLGPGALPQLGAGANLAQNYMIVLGFVSGYLDITHDWGFGPGNIAAYHILSNTSALNAITVTTLANVDSTRWFMVETDNTPSGLVRYNLHGQAQYGSGVIPSGTPSGTAVTITVAHNTGYVRQSTSAAPVDYTRITVTATNRGGLSLPFTLVADPVGSVAQSPMSTVFHVTCFATPSDPNLVGGNLPANLTFNWTAI